MNKKKLIFSLLGIIFLLTFVIAVSYPEPFNSNVDANQYNISNADWVSANVLNGTTITGTFTGEVTGTMNWTKLQNYPAACPGSGAITLLNDSVTCSDLWVDVAGDTMTGALHISNVLNITGNFTINNSVFFVNRDNGRVGIGMTGPSEKLDVAGAIKASGTIYGNRADRFAFYAISGGVYVGGLVDNYFAGNVGIGTDSPTHKLNVVGDVNFTENLEVGGNITGNQFYGEMWMQNESGYVTTAIASSDVWYNLTGFNNTDVVTGQTLHYLY